MRLVYTDEMKRQLAERYPVCLTREDRLELAQELGIDSLHKLYNLVARLGVMSAAAHDAAWSESITVEPLAVETLMVDSLASEPIPEAAPVEELPSVYTGILAAARRPVQPQPVVEPLGDEPNAARDDLAA